MDDCHAAPVATPWLPGRAEMAVWDPADGLRDAGQQFEQLAQHDMGQLRRAASAAAVVMVLVLSGTHWMG